LPAHAQLWAAAVVAPPPNVVTDPSLSSGLDEFFDQLDASAPRVTEDRRAPAVEPCDALAVFPSELRPPAVGIAPDSPESGRPARPTVPALPPLGPPHAATAPPPTAASATSSARDEELRQVVESADARIALLQSQLRQLRRASTWTLVPRTWLAGVLAVLVAGGGAALGLRRTSPQTEPLPVKASRDSGAARNSGASRDSGDRPATDAPGTGTGTGTTAAGRAAEESRTVAATAGMAGEAGSRVGPARAGTRRAVPEATSGARRAAEAPPSSRLGDRSRAVAATPAVVLERTPARRPEALAVGDSLEPVDVEVTVAPDGHAIKAVALSGTEVVQRAAEAAALSWRYRPATAGGSPSQGELRVRVPFDQPPER